ncbi:ExbD/TolR family protein [Salisaeta longa]|uniref:ExbD/TolR family protein n=1 Tax=Salisaeta longa TaxID=503170 RepID=UPI0003B7B6E5|nr:biopolymer transporter ExbD [Salisaeta longa]
MPLDFSPDREPLTTFSLAGMTDIVLLLLVFFLLTSNFIPQMGIQVTLPKVDTSAPVESEFVQVALTEEGQFYVDGQTVPRQSLVQALRRVKGNKSTLVLRADQGATIGQFATVASAAQALNLRVLMATERRSS